MDKGDSKGMKIINNVALILCDIPQGSKLDPFLHKLIINDIVSHVFTSR